MKRKILFSILGGLIIFIWQFLSHAGLNLHKSASEYTPKQNEILTKLEEIGLEQGKYLLGQPDPSKSHEEMEKDMSKYENKPWAVINYQKQMSMNMAMPMIRGIVVDILIAFLMFWLFMQQADKTLKNRLLLALIVGQIVFFFGSYTNFIWYKDPDIFAYFLDAIVPWLALGFIGHKMAK